METELRSVDTDSDVMPRYRVLTKNSFRRKGHAWVTQRGYGYCTDCAREFSAEVVSIRVAEDDECDGCMTPFRKCEYAR